MCGINGIIGFHEYLPEPSVVEAMNRCMAHRGPDNEGLFGGERVLLGHRRLSILDLSEAGNQPFYSPDKRFVLVYNGEIYNFRELRDKLGAAYDFKTNTDTEIIIAAWLKWGIGCLQHFEGMFAFALYDRQSGDTFLTRDRIGIKPLYYHETDQSLVFASEIRSLLASGLVARKINPEGLVDYLRYQTVHAPQTIIKDVKMLPAAHWLRVTSEGETELKKYWEITDTSEEVRKLSPEKIRSDIKELFLQAVSKRLVSDVPFGAFLSGGIDSSAIAGAMSVLSPGKVNTFSVSFEEEEFSEARYAKIVAQKFGTDHHPIRLTPDDFLDLLPEALKAMDHPSGDGPNTYVVSGATKKAGITMALSGLGGDELFAGYDVFKRSRQLEQKRWLQSFPLALRKGAGSLLKMAKPGVASSKIAEALRLDYFDLAYTYPLSRQVILDADIYTLLNTEALPSNAVFEKAKSLVAYGSPGFSMPFFSKVSVLEMGTYMQNVLLRDTDQMSMAHALEVRVPFLDHELVRYVLSVPDSIKEPHSPKQLLVESLGDMLPAEIVNRPKMGFTLPFKVWMKSSLKTFCDERIQRLAARSMFREKQVLRLYNRFLKNDPDVTWSRIWPLVILENWLEEHRIED